MGEYESTRDPTEDSLSDDSLSLSVLNSEEEAVIMEELRRQREESAQRHRCCICGTLYTQDEGRLLWHINPWFFYAFYVHDMHQFSLGQDYLPGTPVSEVLRNAGVLFTDEHGKNWVCICRTCQRIPNLQQGLPETVPHTTPSRSSNEEHPFDNTDIYDTHLNARLRTLDEHRRGQLEALPEGDAEDLSTGQHTPYSPEDSPIPPGNTESVISSTSSSSTHTQLPPSVARAVHSSGRPICWEPCEDCQRVNRNELYDERTQHTIDYFQPEGVVLRCYQSYPHTEQGHYCLRHHDCRRGR